MQSSARGARRGGRRVLDDEGYSVNVALRHLLNRFDTLIRDHEELGDTDVREQMAEAVHHALIAQTPGYQLPAAFGMFSPAGNAAIRAALADFVNAARSEAEQRGLVTLQQRFQAFQDPSVLSDAGHAYDEYFGHADSPFREG